MDEEEDTQDEDVEVVPGAPPEEVPAGPPGGRNLEDAFQGLFKTSASGTGEEELLRIASTYALQINPQQIRALMYVEWVARVYRRDGKDFEASQLEHFVERWLELKQHNGSDMFVMRALDSISLRKFIGENAFKINIEK